MRLLLLILIGALTAAAAPWLLFEARPDLFRDLLPADADVRRAYADLPEVASHLLEAWRTGREPVASEPIFAEARLAGVAAVLGTGLLWFVMFAIGSLIGLVLIRVRTRTLFVVAALFVGLVYLMTSFEVSLQASWEGRRMLETIAWVGLAAVVTGFLTTRLLRRATV